MINFELAFFYYESLFLLSIIINAVAQCIAQRLFQTCVAKRIEI